MENQSKVVLPDTLVAQLIGNAATLSEHLRSDYADVAARRDSLRAQLIAKKQIIKIDGRYEPLSETYAVDGAHLAEIDRASAYSASCAVRVGQKHSLNDQSSCLAILPHVPCLNSLSSGLMMMQEIMMAVKIIEQHPQAICLIDGSKVSAIINIHQFYSGIYRDLSRQLKLWRQKAKSGREPGLTLALFESRDWLTPYLTSSKIVGNLKLVTTTTLIEQYAPQWVGRFDDKTFAALVLDSSEVLEPVPLPQPSEPYHLHKEYPYAKQLDVIGDQLTQLDHSNRIFHIYYRPDEPHGVFKIELNQSLLNQPEQVGALIAWWRQEIPAVDLQEPYSFYIADRFAKEAVSVAKKALREIARRDAATAPWAWFFTQPYRTE